MKKTRFHIAHMDCPSEEQLIRMALADCAEVRALQFDIPGRCLTVYHHGSADAVEARIERLKLGCARLESVSAADGVPPVDAEGARRERVLLWQVLAINGFCFVLEAVSGWLAGSMGLLADSLDMLADSAVYALALLAVGAGRARQQGTALAAGVLQLGLALWGFVEVVRRFAGGGGLPDVGVMIAVSLIALVGNALCLYLLQKNSSRDAHMQASRIFTGNDIIANLGVVAAGVLTLWTHSPYPDLIVGSVVFAVVIVGAWKILQLSRR